VGKRKPERVRQSGRFACFGGHDGGNLCDLSAEVKRKGPQTWSQRTPGNEKADPTRRSPQAGMAS
jgi:hypothetical protein